MNRRPRKGIVDDDDDEEHTTQAATTAAERVVNPFGSAIGQQGPMGLTQAFAATMSDSQLLEQDSMADLPPMTFPNPPTPGFNTLVADSQPPGTSHAAANEVTGADETQISLHLSQSQVVPDSLAGLDLTEFVQPSQMPDPTQDAGFEQSSPVGGRYTRPPPSTVETLPISPTSPRPKNKTGRLRRRNNAIAVLSDLDEDGAAHSEDDDRNTSSNAFNVMKKSVRTARDTDFQKKNSKAKEMVEELAEESEDEYAGLGGMSGEDSGSEDEDVQKMIDTGDVHVDERQIAAFHA